MQPAGRGKTAVQQANLSSDYTVLGVTFFVLFVLTSLVFVIDFFTNESFKTYKNSMEILIGFIITLILGLVLFATILGLGMFMVRMQRQTVLGNAMQVEYSDYAWLRDWCNETAKELEMPEVEIFVTQDPYINAYALGFIRPYIVVINSGTVRYMTNEEIKVTILHEMGHIKYGHTNASVFLNPFTAIPIVGNFTGWLAGFWSRRAELTSDRLALMYTRDPELVKNALVKLHVGPDVAGSMNDVARQWQKYKAERPMNRFAQTFSSHPFLVRRLIHIDRWRSVIEPTPAQHSATPPPVARSDGQ